MLAASSSVGTILEQKGNIAAKAKAAKAHCDARANEMENTFESMDDSEFEALMAGLNSDLAGDGETAGADGAAAAQKAEEEAAAAQKAEEEAAMARKKKLEQRRQAAAKKKEEKVP